MLENNIKFRLVKMEKYAMIQFDSIDPSFGSSIKIPKYDNNLAYDGYYGWSRHRQYGRSPSLNKQNSKEVLRLEEKYEYGIDTHRELSWRFNVHFLKDRRTSINLTRQKDKRYVNIYINPNKELVKNNTTLNELIRGYGKLNREEYNNKVITLKFHNNTERDIFCEGFVKTMKEFSKIINKDKEVEAL